jgi:FKBP-type peptidyl-prolyl cis-trans isomerase SlyD
MGIDRNSLVTFEYVLRNANSELIEASPADDPPSYIHGYGQLIPGLEKHMKGHSQGDRFHVEVPASHGYGERDESLVVTVPRTEIPDGVPLSIGQSFDAVNDHGHSIKLRVKNITATEVMLDANHPLSGIDLHYDITIKAVRPAREDELMQVAAPIMGTDDDDSGSHA